MTSKRILRQLLLKFGYDVRRIGGSSPGYAPPDMWNWMRSTQNIRTVIDIGANVGEFAEFLATYFNAEKTYAIEPLPSCAQVVRERGKTIRNLEVFECALSDTAGKATLYENSYAPASSMLPVSSISATEFPQTATNSGEVEVAVARLDDLIDVRDVIPGLLIKIDVQGMEHHAISGGKKIFGAAQCVLIEMSFVPMYDGQPLFEEVHELLCTFGFRLSGIKNQIDSPKTGQPLFMHCLYVKQ